MENKLWIDILLERKKMDPDYEITMINTDPEFYLLEGISRENSIDEMMLVYDCSAFSEKCTFAYDEMNRVNEEYCDAYPVVVFKNWEQERQIYSKYYETIKGMERKNFSEWYEKKMAIYTQSVERIVLETDNEGINYLEYPVKDLDSKSVLRGRVYNVSFYELKKLFNVTGNHLFVKNVRYGLKGNKTAKDLRVKFREYLCSAIYKRFVGLGYDEMILEDLKEILNIDEKLSEFLKADETKNVEYDYESYLPENFWFYHNGITIFSYEEAIETPSNQIVLYPEKVSVINGAQTLTNFFLEVEAIEKALEVFCEKIKISEKKILEEIIKIIYVKTIIVNGNDKFVRPITHGLNTQIPIFEESLLADSKLCEEINKCLAKESNPSNRIRILKDGEVWTGDNGLSVLEFVKYWLTIKKMPGRSKNLAKSQLEEILNDVKNTLNQDTGEIRKLGDLKQVYEWWDETKLEREKDCSDDINIVVAKYGRNYFGSYVLNSNIDEFLDENRLTILYECFMNDIKNINQEASISINVGTFKKDELSTCLFELQEKRSEEKKEERIVVPKTMKIELLKRLNLNEQNAYSFSKTIANYLMENGIDIEYFRVISRSNKKCREAFPFPNSTFSEIIDSFDIETKNEEKITERIVAYEKSMLSKAVSREFPVFVIDKDDQKEKNYVSNVQFIENFSFEKYDKEAKEVYEKTIEAFKLGDESKFPKSSEDLKFHVRPKAVNSEDTFQFTNGNFITKRTFWANKTTVESILSEKIKSIE